MTDNLKSVALTEVTLYILLSLYTPKHGYGIMQFVEEETNGRLSLGPGTLYGAITTLSKKGWIELIKEEGNKKKKIYLISDLGKSIVENELNRLRDLLSTANKIIEMG